MRVLLGGELDQFVLRADGLRCEPAPPFELNGEVEVRTQSRGLLVLGAGKDAWVFDSDDMLRFDWDGPATIAGSKKAADKAAAKSITYAHYGSLFARNDGDKGIRRVLHTELELYTTGVIAAEMGTRFATEALAAQAIVARGFALSARSRRTRLEFDVFDDVRDQVYRGVHDHPALIAAVRKTRGKILRYAGKRLRTYYSSTCGGATRDGYERFRDVPREPFAGVPCEGCTESPRFRWKRDIPRRAFTNLGFRSRGTLRFRAIDRSKRGDWIRMQVSDGGGAQELTARTLHKLRPLPSLWLDSVRSVGDKVEVRGRGFGHGVGLCQYGAGGYAASGMDHQQILAHYFPGASIEALHTESVESR